MMSSYSANRDEHFWSSLRYVHRKLGLRSWDYGMTDIARKNARVFMIQNFDNTEKWEDKAGNT